MAWPGVVALVLLVTTPRTGDLWAAESGEVRSVGKAPPPVLSKFEDARRKRLRWRTDFEATGTNERAFAKGADHLVTFRQKFIYYRDGDKIDVRVFSPDGGARSIVNGWYIMYPLPAPGKLAHSGKLRVDGKKELLYVLPGGLGAFEGYLAENRLDIVEIFRDDAQQLREEPNQLVDGRLCVLLNAVTANYGTYKLWLDPAAAYLPRKVIVEKSPHDYFGPQPLEEQKHFAPYGSKGVVAATGFSYELSEVQIDTADGVPFPSSFRLTRTLRFLDGNSGKVTLKFRRTKLDLNPDFISDKVFQPELEDGTPLVDEQNPDFPFQWEKGRLIPLVDTRAREHAQPH